MTKNIAHRGFSGKYPENTMLAFSKAVEIGSDGIELDVHFSKDGEVVIIHDESVNRTTDAKGLVVDFTAAELHAMDASAGFRGVYGRNPVPTLREYFELVAPVPGFITNIELKTGVNEYFGIESAVIDMIHEFGLTDRIIISSFNHNSVLRSRALDPEIKTGFLEESWIVDFGAYTENLGVDCIHPHFASVTPENYCEVKRHGREINTWTVNREEDIRRMAELGVDAIIGNYPDLAKKVLDEMNAK